MSGEGRSRVTLALLGILILATALRVWGCLGQGLPHCYYPDEQNNVERVLRFGAERTLNPNGWFNKPALGYYVLLCEYGAYYGVGRLAGWWEDPQSFGVQYFANKAAFVLIGRLSTALFGVLTVFLTFRLGRRFGGDRVGLLAALVLAVTLGHVATSQQVKMDVPAAFWNTACLCMLMGVMATGRWRDYVLAGLFAGLGAATKYYSFAMVFPMVLAHLMRSGEARALASRVWLSPRPLIAGVALFVGFFVGSPYNTLDGWWQGRGLRLLSWVGNRLGLPLGELQSPAVGPLVTDGHSVMDSLERLLSTFYGVDGVGWVLALLTLCGAVYCLIKRTRSQVFLLLTSVIVLLVIALANRQFSAPRHLNILYPMTSVLAAIGLAGLARMLPNKAARVRWLVGLPLLLPLWNVVVEDARRMEPDVRNRVEIWLRDSGEVPPGAVIINDHGCLPLALTKERCDWASARVGALLAQVNKRIATAESVADPVQRRERVAFNVQRASRLRTSAVEWRYRTEASELGYGPQFDVVAVHQPWMTESLASRPRAALGYNPLWPRSPWGDGLDRIVTDLLARDKPVTAASVRDQLLHWLRAAYLEATVRKATRDRSIATLDELVLRVDSDLRKEWADMGGAWPHHAPSVVELWARSTPLSRQWLTHEQTRSWVRRPVQFIISSRASYENYTDPARPWKRMAFPDWAGFYQDLNANYDGWEFNSDSEEMKTVIRVWDVRTRKPGTGRVKVEWR